MPDLGPVDRAREEGASPGLVRLVDRVGGWIPRVAGSVGTSVATYGRFARHRGTVLAGGLAFFALLSMVPAIISLGAVAALLFDPAEFVADVKELLADQPELIATFGPLLDEIAALGQKSLSSVGVAGLVSVGVSLYAASRFVYVVQQVLDVAFELEPRHPSLLSRGISIVITFLALVLVVVAIIAMGLIPPILDTLGIGALHAQNVRLLRVPVAVGVVYLLLTAALRFGIEARRVVGWVNLGAAAGALLILVGTLGLSWYLSFSTTYSQIVTVLGGVIALQLWLYVVGLAVVGAAEIEGIRNGFRRRDLGPADPA
ncbi:MAG TPA: YihY/virulence factor BrkB family protein [Motilibacterales bacterium]|nr:YihY/virulence factor BrkB family protein [Motilibacterales bacterium]